MKQSFLKGSFENFLRNERRKQYLLEKEKEKREREQKNENTGLHEEKKIGEKSRDSN